MAKEIYLKFKRAHYASEKERTSLKRESGGGAV